MLMKESVNGRTYYYGVQLQSLEMKFNKTEKYHDIEDAFEFDVWNKVRQEDGFLCRNQNHTDCKWIDENLECQQVGSFNWTIQVNFRLFWQLCTKKNWKKVGNALTKIQPRDLKFACQIH